MDSDSFSFFCVGLECDTEDEAWSTWKAEARTYFKWIKGKKIWRTLPEVFKQQIFSENKTVYIVKASVLPRLVLGVSSMALVFTFGPIKIH